MYRDKLIEITDKMTKDGLRHPSPGWNNFCRSNTYFPGCSNNKYMDCGEQVEYVNDILSKGDYKSNWIFYLDSGVGHAWGLAISSDHNDPIITYDTRSSSIGIGTECQTCKPWFGKSEFQKIPAIRPRRR